MTTPQGQELPNSAPVAAEEPTGTGPAVPSAPAPEADNKPIYWQQLEQLPEDVRPLVEPVFKDWDAGVSKRLQSVHSEYEPYKALVDEYEAEALQQAVQLAQALEANPEAFARNLLEAYGIDLGQGAASPPQSAPAVMPDATDPSALPDDPRFARLDQHEQLLQTMAEALLAERQEKALAQSSAQLDTVLNDLRTQYGEFDENYVLTHIANGVDPLQAVGMFHTAVEAYMAKQNQPDAPQVIGQGGGYPSQQVDPTTLNNQDTEKLIVDMLRAANQQG